MPYDPSWDKFLDEEIGTPQEEYQPSTQFAPPIPTGRYIVAGMKDKWNLGRSDKDGRAYISKALFYVAEGDHIGAVVQGFISDRPKPWRNTGTDMDDFLRAGGLKPEGDRFTAQEVAVGVDATWESHRKVQVDTEFYCKACNITFARGRKGYTTKSGDVVQSILDEKGNERSVITCPHCGAEVMGRNFISRIYVA